MAIHQTVHTHLQNATAPWSSLLIVPNGKTAAAMIKPPAGFTLRTIQGKKCGTPAGIFNEFARALEFPDYFGHNWDGLEECLADLEWLPAKGYVLLISDAHCVLPDDEEEYETFLEILSDAGEAWSKGHTGDGRRAPFHVFFAVSERDRDSRPHWGLTELPATDEAPKARGVRKKKAGGKRTE